MHVSNKRYYVSDMVFTAGKIRLKLLDNTGNAVLVKNLYLSCDSYMRNRMSKLVGSCIESMVPGEVHSNISRIVFISCKITMSMFLLNSFPPVTWTVKFDLWCFCWWSLVVQPISGLGVCKVVDSKYPDLKEIWWGKWQGGRNVALSQSHRPCSRLTDVSLSYYTGYLISSYNKEKPNLMKLI